MTEETTTVTATDLLDFIRIAVRLGNNRKAHEALCDLDSALTSGSPLPDQWPQAKELEDLRAKVARIERVNIDLETQYTDAQLKIVEMKKELDSYSYHTKLSLELGERYVQQESEMTQKLIAQRAELDSLKEKVAKYEDALREIACYRIDAIGSHQGIDQEDVKIIEAIARTVLEP
jgi:predicted RNase H-like nuclease (RuvC/YqgF family)